MFNDSITIFNKKFDKVKRDYDYIRSYIRGVNIEKKKAVNVIKSGLENASSSTVYIPTEYLQSEKEYISPKKYQILEKDNVSCYYTFQPGDFVVIGIIDYLVEENSTITELKNKYDDVFEILAVDDRLKGSLPHWEVTLK